MKVIARILRIFLPYLAFCILTPELKCLAQPCPVLEELEAAAIRVQLNSYASAIRFPGGAIAVSAISPIDGSIQTRVILFLAPDSIYEVSVYTLRFDQATGAFRLDQRVQVAAARSPQWADGVAGAEHVALVSRREGPEDQEPDYLFRIVDFASPGECLASLMAPSSFVEAARLTHRFAFETTETLLVIDSSVTQLPAYVTQLLERNSNLSSELLRLTQQLAESARTRSLDTELIRALQRKVLKLEALAGIAANIEKQRRDLSKVFTRIKFLAKYAKTIPGARAKIVRAARHAQRLEGANQRAVASLLDSIREFTAGF